MNRKDKRKAIRKQSKPKYSLVDIQKAIVIAVEMKRASNGHLFKKELKNRCVFCGKGLKSKMECEYWFMTFLDRMQTVLINPDFFTDKNIEAIWVQHGYEYKDIKVKLP